ncbi:MAG: PilZ domain-containing protein [Planctomycetota bacterium]|nr:PilZ domain-containing protein [Planctomycetota bacterium]
MNHERRRQNRLPISQSDSVEVHYQFVDVEGLASHPHPHSGRALNISRSGARIQGSIPDESWVTRLLNVQDILALEMHCGSTNSIRAIASVQWIRRSAEQSSYEFGLKFERLPDSDAKELARFIAIQERASGRLHQFPGTL